MENLKARGSWKSKIKHLWGSGFRICIAPESSLQ